MCYCRGRRPNAGPSPSVRAPPLPPLRHPNVDRSGSGEHVVSMETASPPPSTSSSRSAVLRRTFFGFYFSIVVFVRALTIAPDARAPIVADMPRKPLGTGAHVSAIPPVRPMTFYHTAAVRCESHTALPP